MFSHNGLIPKKFMSLMGIKMRFLMLAFRLGSIVENCGKLKLLKNIKGYVEQTISWMGGSPGGVR